MNLFNFLYNTLLPKVNDPGNGHFWLPKVLQDIDGSSANGKLLPIELTNWDVGAITGEGGSTVTKSFTQQWALYIHNVLKKYTNDSAIADPAAPEAILSFNSATVLGLHNLLVLGNPVVNTTNEGYQATITLQTDYYDGTNGRQLLPKLGISGIYNLSQKLCTASSSNATKCNGDYSEQIDGVGSVIADINNAFIEADISITVDGSGDARTAKVTVTRVMMRGPLANSTPNLEIVDLKIINSSNAGMEGAWISSSKTALSTTSGRAGIFAQINASLKSDYNLKSLSDTITSQLQLVLNDLIGAVPGNILPSDSGQNISNAADMYVFDRMRFSLNDVNGQWFLPKLLCGFNDPALEPLTIDEIALPGQSADDLVITSIKLLDIKLEGLSNMLAPASQMLFDEDMGLQATINLSALTNPPSNQYNGKTIPLPPLKGAGNFAMMFEDDDETYPGTFALEVNSSQLSFSTKLDGSDVSSLQITILSAVIKADPANVKLTITVDSFFNDIINQIINEPSIINSVIGKINDALASNLDAISTQVTASARAGIMSRLDG